MGRNRGRGQDRVIYVPWVPMTPEEKAAEREQTLAEIYERQGVPNPADEDKPQKEVEDSPPYWAD